MKKVIIGLALISLNQTSLSYAQSCPSDCSSGTVMGAFTPSGFLSGGGNVFLGAYAGSNTTTGANNVFVGQEAGYLNLTGNNNTFIGPNTGNSNTQGSDNAFVGIDTGANNTTGTNNTMMGSSAGQSNTSGSHNIYFGRNAGRNNSIGEFNAFLGYNSGYHNTGSHNLFLGYRAGENEAGSHMLHIADSPFTSLIKGDFSNQWVNISNKLGIGTDNPSEALAVVGNGIANQWLTYSDERLKDDIKVIEGAMGKLSLLEGLTYRLNVATGGKLSSESGRRNYGVSAQRVKAIAPDLVQEDNQGLLSVNYDGLIPLLIEALKEKDQEIKVMRTELDNINQKLSKGG